MRYLCGRRYVFQKSKVTYILLKKTYCDFFAFFISHKLVGLIEKSNNILQKVLKKMRELRKEYKDALFWIASQVNSWIIKHLGNSLVEIITRIQPLISVERKI